MIVCLPTPHPNTHLCTPTTSLHHYHHHHHLASQPASQPFIDSSLGSSRSIVGRRSVWLAGWQHHKAKSAKSDCGAPLLLLLCVISHKHQKRVITPRCWDAKWIHLMLHSLPHSLPPLSCGDVSSMISAAKNKNLVSYEKRLVCISCPTI